MKTEVHILKDHHLRTTTSRSAILNLFIKNPFALSYSDIEREIAESYDRVTVYRTLKTFLDKGVIHKVLDDEGGLKYALCSEPCSTREHHHEHVHFKCQKCGQTNCLDTVTIPDVQLPGGYRIKEMNLLIQGICDKCRQ
ncbi:MAG: transcriptional repressor [Cyclobacteriaceae bacterium]|jgi:Fur family transcriptional regulator, ferric uptake regulator|nr:transcriptional repressor [Cyclobacteriaceae bacterium]